MADSPCHAEKRSMLRPRRTQLEDFTCIDTTSYCHDACDGFEDCEIGEAYREYLDLQRCARLLRELDKRWLERLRKAFLSVTDPSFRDWINLSELTGRIHQALRNAGLL